MAGKKCPTMKALGRKWNKMTSKQQSKYRASGKKSSWNVFVAKMRKNCKGKL